MIHRLKPESYYWLVVRFFWLILTITVLLQVNRVIRVWETDMIEKTRLRVFDVGSRR